MSAKVYRFSTFFTRAVLIIFSLLLSSCAYQLGSQGRSLPGGYKQVHIPIFKNYSQEPGMEVLFTNALRQEFERSQIARIAEPQQSEVILEGRIDKISYLMNSAKQNNDTSIPQGTVLATQYSINVHVTLSLLRLSDRKSLWSSNFVNERIYTPPQLATAGINTANPLYNLSARRQNIEVMAGQMMIEAHDRLTENF